MKSLYGLLFVLILMSCNSQNEKTSTEIAPKQVALIKLDNSPAFNQSFHHLMQAYFALKNSFIAEKDSGIAQNARTMIKAADSLQLNELKADSSLIFTAKSYSEGISSELMGLLGETQMLSKRRSFQMVSDQLYDLIRTVQYNQLHLLHAYCNDAFDDQGAYWICEPQDIQNPYLGSTGTKCFEVKDSIQVGIVH